MKNKIYYQCRCCSKPVDKNGKPLSLEEIKHRKEGGTTGIHGWCCAYSNRKVN